MPRRLALTWPQHFPLPHLPTLLNLIMFDLPPCAPSVRHHLPPRSPSSSPPTRPRCWREATLTRPTRWRAATRDWRTLRRRRRRRTWVRVRGCVACAYVRGVCVCAHGVRQCNVCSAWCAPVRVRLCCAFAHAHIWFRGDWGVAWSGSVGWGNVTEGAERRLQQCSVATTGSGEGALIFRSIHTAGCSSPG